MPRLTRIYTRSGDDGETALGSGRRVAKDHVRIEAYGAVDELNSVLGVVLAADAVSAVATILGPVQNELFHLGSDLCFPEKERGDIQIPVIEERHVRSLEEQMDRLSQELGPLENFIIPGGGPAAANLHLARTVCRRAERRVVELRREEPVADVNVRYLNRLSDLLFVLARYQNLKQGVNDVLWDSHA